LQPGGQQSLLFLVKSLLVFRQKVVDLPPRYGNSQVPQLFQEERLGHMIMVVLVEAVADESVPKVLTGEHLWGQRSQQGLAVWRPHPLPQVTIAGGVGKISKLAQGLLDLHSKRGAVDLATLARLAEAAGGSSALCARIAVADSAAQSFSLAKAEEIGLGNQVAQAAQTTALGVVAGRPIAIEVVIFDRDGQITGRAPFAAA